MSRQEYKRYPERDGPFFRIRSKNRLANLLHISPRQLRSLASSKDLYHEFTKNKSNGKSRLITAPREPLKSVQRRIATLLQRIQLPNCVFSPVKGRSYVHNALAHLGASSIYLLDISDYYPNCKSSKVIWYFSKQMQCSIDVATLLCRIVTHKGSLPQGSPCSPILAYLCYQDMWNEIRDVVEPSGCRLSIYVDDITVSGTRIPKGMHWKIKKVLHRHGHRYNSEKFRSRHMRSAEITGIIINGDRATVPNRQLKRLHDLQGKVKTTKSVQETCLLNQQIVGRRSQIEYIRSVSEKIKVMGRE